MDRGSPVSSVHGISLLVLVVKNPLANAKYVSLIPRLGRSPGVGYMCVYIYIYIYTHLCISIHTHIYICC